MSCGTHHCEQNDCSNTFERYDGRSDTELPQPMLATVQHLRLIKPTMPALRLVNPPNFMKIGPLSASLQVTGSLGGIFLSGSRNSVHESLHDRDRFSRSWMPTGEHSRG